MTTGEITTRLFVRGLGHRYGSKDVLRGVSLELKPGIVGLLGPNGAGKTTFLRVLARTLTPTSGEIEYPDLPGDVDRVGYLPQEPAVLRHFTALEFLEYVAWLRRIPSSNATQAARDALGAVDLLDRANEKIRRLSGGMRQRVGLAASIVNAPQLLLLDEPTNGLDLEQRLHFREIVRQLSPGAITVISSHLTEDVAPVCDYVVVMRDGCVVFSGSLQAMCHLAEDAPRPVVDQLNHAYLELVQR